MMALQPKPMTDTPASLKNLVEPLPASALMGLIKVEQQQHQLPTAPVPVYATQPQNNLVKVGWKTPHDEIDDPWFYAILLVNQLSG